MLMAVLIFRRNEMETEEFEALERNEMVLRNFALRTEFDTRCMSCSLYVFFAAEAEDQ